MDESRVATSLRRARERRGWSREALAYHSGVSWAAITQIESGRRKDIRLTSLSALADALQVTTDFLVGAATPTAAPLLEHQALLFETDDEFLAGALPFLHDGTDRSEPVLAVTTRARIRLLREALDTSATQVEFAESSRWYRSPAEALSRYRDFLDRQHSAGASWVWILGEPVWTSRSPQQIAVWHRYEALINMALAATPATIMCLYDTRSVPESVVRHAQETHPDVVRDGHRGPSPAYRAPEEFLLRDDDEDG